MGYLGLNGARLHSREKLATLLWRDASANRARNAFKTTLWRLRRSLEPPRVERGTFIRINSAGEIGLNWSRDIWCDVHAFQSALSSDIATGNKPADDTTLRQLRESVKTLNGELLEGFYDDWIITERERLNAALARALSILMREARLDGDCAAALDYGRRILERDPLRESVYREMIKLHLRLGQRTQALRQYERCVRVIREELDVDPMPETSALYAQIIAGVPDSIVSNATEQELEAVMHGIKDAMRQLGEVHAELARHLPEVGRSPNRH